MVELFMILLVAGLLLVGAEIFVPGGVVGVMGGLALVGAMGVGFLAFPGLGAIIALGILVLLAVVVMFWLKYFPKSGIGKKMTVSVDMAESTASDSRLLPLVGKDGIALSQLRPAGYVQVDGTRVDVVTRGEMIEKGARVKVVSVHGNSAVVAQVQ